MFPPIRVSGATVDLLGGVSLSLFLVMALMGMRLVDLVSLAGPLLVILALQTIAMALYAVFVTFRVMGRDYDAAVLAAGHVGFALSSTAAALAIMKAVTERRGPSPLAFVIVPMVGAFFIDIANALMIQGYLPCRSSGSRMMSRASAARRRLSLLVAAARPRAARAAPTRRGCRPTCRTRLESRRQAGTVPGGGAAPRRQRAAAGRRVGRAARRRLLQRDAEAGRRTTASAAGTSSGRRASPTRWAPPTRASSGCRPQNRAGDLVRAYGSAIYEQTADGWMPVATDAAAPATAPRRTSRARRRRRDPSS